MSDARDACELRVLPPGFAADTSVFGAWFALACAMVAYSITRIRVERMALQHPARCPTLYDFGHEWLPRCSEYWVDIMCSGLAMIMLYLGAVAGLCELMRWGLLWMALGNAMSATLHSFTIIGDLQNAAAVAKSGAARSIAAGGFCDRLLSNHTYNAGIAMLAVEFQWGLPAWVAWLGCGTVGVAIVATRCHYTVDVVLAWWALASVRAYAVASCQLPPTLL